MKSTQDNENHFFRSYLDTNNDLCILKHKSYLDTDRLLYKKHTQLEQECELYYCCGHSKET